MADDESDDPMGRMQEHCMPHCAVALNAYDACQARIQKKGDGNCEAWYADLVHCVDTCVSKTLFEKLK